MALEQREQEQLDRWFFVTTPAKHLERYIVGAKHTIDEWDKRILELTMEAEQLQRFKNILNDSILEHHAALNKLKG